MLKCCSLEENRRPTATEKTRQARRCILTNVKASGPVAELAKVMHSYQFCIKALETARSHCEVGVEDQSADTVFITQKEQKWDVCIAKAIECVKTYTLFGNAGQATQHACCS